jgi:hypothetical protein
MNAIVNVRFARKPSSMHDVKSAVRDEHGEVFECEIAETVELSFPEYDAFTCSFLRNHAWLDGKGGYKNKRRQVIAVTAPGAVTLYVDPSGSAYGRYVGTRVVLPKYRHIRVQLTGNDGNAFMVLGLCQRAAKRMGLAEEEINAFFAEAQAGDYDHLLQTCQRWFTIN